MPLTAGSDRVTVSEDSEAQIERYLHEQVVARKGWTQKFVSTGRRGVPDRIVFLPVNRVFFVELKKQSGTIRQHQWLWAVKMLDYGVNVEFLKSKAEVDAFLRRVG